MLKKEDTIEAETRINNLEELDNAIAQFEKERGEDATLSNYLEEMTLASDLDQQDPTFNAITMMTLHISKGLEYPFVFIVGCEENLFPSVRGDETDDSDIEEERRLAYVGMTRARKKLWLTHAKMRRVWGQEQMNLPSRFIKEIPKELVHFTAAQSFAEPSRFASQYGSSFGQTASGSYGTQSHTKNSPAEDHIQYFSDDEDYSQIAQSGSGYNKGQRVRHPTFGVGSIFSLEGSGSDLKISVLFQDQTIKKFVAKYARLEKV